MRTVFGMAGTGNYSSGLCGAPWRPSVGCWCTGQNEVHSYTRGHHSTWLLERPLVRQILAEESSEYIISCISQGRCSCQSMASAAEPCRRGARQHVTMDLFGLRAETGIERSHIYILGLAASSSTMSDGQEPFTRVPALALSTCQLSASSQLQRSASR